MGLVVRMVLCGALLTACTAQQPQGTGQGDGGISGGDGGTGSWWQPRPGTSWQWQLSGALDVTVDAGVYDIDLFDNAPAQIAALQGMGRKVVCYFDTAYEPGRPDSSQLDPYKGNPVSGWPGQYWLDIRQPAVVNVMKAESRSRSRRAATPSRPMTSIRAPTIPAFRSRQRTSRASSARSRPRPTRGASRLR